MRIAICEDEVSQSARLSEAITDWAKTRRVDVDITCYDSAESFIMAYPEVSFDIAFLDIQMKNISGIQLAEIIRENDETMLLVFITGYEQYAIKGYDVNALHYLIKPVSPAKLLPVLDKAHSLWRTHQNDYLLVSDKDGQHKLPLSDIYYMSMAAHNAEVFTANGTYTLRKTVNELLKLLPAHFVRCHSSYIVNLYKVDCVYKETIRLNNNAELPLSRSNTKNIRDAFMRLHMGSTK